jgi:hypothetical protein
MWREQTGAGFGALTMVPGGAVTLRGRSET